MRANKKVVITGIIALIVIASAAIVYIGGKDVSSKVFGEKSTATAKNTLTENTPQDTSTPVTAQTSSTPATTGTQATNTNQDGNTEKDNSNQETDTKRFKAKAIYVTGVTAGSKAGLNRIIELVKNTELNSIVLDIKEDGRVNYQSAIPEVIEYSAITKNYNVDTVIKTLHENNIHVIGRIVCFRDPVLAKKRLDLAIKGPNGQLWRENGKIPWTNPYNEEVWKYNIDIAKEAVDKGFDEIQFDYVRFPTARKSEIYYGSNPPTKSDAICKFLETAQKELHDGKGTIVSADVFGIICESPGDMEGIGQDIEKVGKYVDYLSPMVYPSHYANKKQNKVGQGINGVLFTAPDLEPYKVVYNSLVKAKDRVSKVEGYKSTMRPYLQDFTASWLSKGYYQKYGVEQVKDQIKAVYDAGYDEWILWNSANVYSEGALAKE